MVVHRCYLAVREGVACPSDTSFCVILLISLWLCMWAFSGSSGGAVLWLCSGISAVASLVGRRKLWVSRALVSAHGLLWSWPWAPEHRLKNRGALA